MDRTMTHRPTLSKSSFLCAAQCQLRLWLETHRRDLVSAPDACAEALAAAGREVGELARGRFPGGRVIADDHRHVRAALDETRRILESDAVGALFEAAFAHAGVLVRTDVAVQLFVLRGAGLDVRDPAVLIQALARPVGAHWV